MGVLLLLHVHLKQMMFYMYVRYVESIELKEAIKLYIIFTILINTNFLSTPQIGGY